MKNKILLLLILMVSCLSYANDNVISVYKNNDLKETNVKSKMFSKVVNDKVYNIKLIIGETFLGDVASVSLEVVDDEDSIMYNYLSSSKEEITKSIEAILISLKSKLLKPGPTDNGWCILGCNDKWNCYDKETNAGILLCIGDCVIECARK